MKRALITGITGQDGSYLAELLISKGYEVHGIVRRESIEDPSHRLSNISHIVDRVKLHVGSLNNHLSLYKIVNKTEPDECYHLAAASFVSYSFDDESLVLENNFSSTHYLLSSIKELRPSCRFYFAGSSEMFGSPAERPQSEENKFNPRSTYGIAKVASSYLIKNYRQQYDIFSGTGIMYNHESPRRGYEFVTRKITSSVARIKLGLSDSLELGNLDARRDWGYAPEYVYAMWQMLQQKTPDDYVIATGVLHSVRKFLEVAFSVVDLDYKKYVKENSEYFRPDEGIPLVGDSSKAMKTFGWKPKKLLEDIVSEMVAKDIDILEKVL